MVNSFLLLSSHKKTEQPSWTRSFEQIRMYVPYLCVLLFIQIRQVHLAFVIVKAWNIHLVSFLLALKKKQKKRNKNLFHVLFQATQNIPYLGQFVNRFQEICKRIWYFDNLHCRVQDSQQMLEKNKNVSIIYQNLQSATALSFYQFITYSKKLFYCSIVRSYLHYV